MKQAIAARAKELLAEGKIKGFLAMSEADGQVAPRVFYRPSELDALNLGEKDAPGDSRYPVIKMLTRIMNASPGDTFGVMVRGCDERALMRRFLDDRVKPLDRSRVMPMGFACPEELAQKHGCQKPWPDCMVAGEKAPAQEAKVPTGDIIAELETWFKESDRCVKCFGCRNSCPVCSCLECTMETEAHVPQRELPPARSFLLTRAVHMLDRCVYCNLCEEACPADIPLTKLYRLVQRLAGGGGLGLLAGMGVPRKEIA